MIVIVIIVIFIIIIFFPKVPEAGVCYIDEAMVAITGMISQNAFFGTTGPSMWLPGSSAFEGSRGFRWIRGQMQAIFIRLI